MLKSHNNIQLYDCFLCEVIEDLCFGLLCAMFVFLGFVSMCMCVLDWSLRCSFSVTVCQFIHL